MRRLLRWLVALCLVGWLLTGVREVGPGERGVVRRFGRVLDAQPHAGLWIGFPWPIDRIDLVPIEKVRRIAVGYNPLEATDDTPAGQLLTGDRNLVNVRIVLNYSVDADRVVEHVEQQERVEDLLVRSAESALAEWVAGRTVDEVILRGKTTLPHELPARLRARLAPYGLGVEIGNIDVAYLAPPDDVKAAFDRVAEAEVQRRKLREEAREETHRNESESRARIRKMTEDADAYAIKRPRLAQAQASAFEERLQALRENPLAREAGRWTHLMLMLKRLTEAGNLQPLDPALDSPLPGGAPAPQE